MTHAESITVSLEWAKKLRAAGWPQSEPTALFVYRDEHLEYCGDEPPIEGKFQRYGLAAPTAEEILRRLPDNIEIYVSNYSGLKKRYGILLNLRRGIKLPKGIMAHNDEEDSLANACAADYCYLAKNNLLPEF